MRNESLNIRPFSSDGGWGTSPDVGGDAVGNSTGCSPDERQARDDMAPMATSHDAGLNSFFTLALVSLLLAGCKGVPTKDENEARQQAQAVAADYRPRGQKPALPVLTANSSISNYLAFAMLNQPKV